MSKFACNNFLAGRRVSTMTTNTQGLVSSAIVCDRLGVSRATLIRWVAAERIKPVMQLPGLTGAFLFAPDEIERVRQLDVEEGDNA